MRQARPEGAADHTPDHRPVVGVRLRGVDATRTTKSPHRAGFLRPAKGVHTGCPAPDIGTVSRPDIHDLDEAGANRKDAARLARQVEANDIKWPESDVRLVENGRSFFAKTAIPLRA